MAPSRAATFDMIRPPTSTTARAESSSEQVAPCMREETLLYRASKLDCEVCPLKPQCCPKEPSRKIPRDVHEHARDVARSFAGTEGFEQSRRERKKIEMRFAHLKRILRLGRLRLRGPRGAQDEFVLAAIAQNSGASRRWLRDHHQLLLCVLRSVGVALRALGSADQRRSAQRMPNDIRSLQPTFATVAATRLPLESASMSAAPGSSGIFAQSEFFRV